MDSQPLPLLSNQQTDGLPLYPEPNLQYDEKTMERRGIIGTIATKLNGPIYIRLVVTLLVLLSLLLYWVMVNRGRLCKEQQPPQVVGGTDIYKPRSAPTTDRSALLTDIIEVPPTIDSYVLVGNDEINGEGSSLPKATSVTDKAGISPAMISAVQQDDQPFRLLLDIKRREKNINERDRLDMEFQREGWYWNVNRARRAIQENEPLTDNDIDTYVRTGSYEWRDSIYVAFDPEAEDDVDYDNDGGSGNDIRVLSAANPSTVALTLLTTDKMDEQKKRNRKVTKKYNWKSSSKMFGQCSMFAMNDLLTVLIRLSSSLGQEISTIEGDTELNSETKIPVEVGVFFEQLLSTLRKVESYITQVIHYMRDTVHMQNGKYTNRFGNMWTNWYQVSIIYPALLAYYLLVPYSLRDIDTEVVLDQVRAIISSPYMSLGVVRDGANAVAMYGPWLFALIYQHNCDQSAYNVNVIQNPYYARIANELTLPEEITPLAVGWHRDGSFISHSTCLGFGYLRMMCSPITNYAFAFDTYVVSKTTLMHKWREVMRVILHPTIARGPPGILNRDSTFRSIVEPHAELGCDIMQFGKMLRINGKGGRVVVRGIHAGLGYFEADQANDRYAQYWVQARAPYTSDMPTEIPPFERAYEIVYVQGETDYKRLRSRTSTTDIYYPNEMSRCYVGVSVEGARERFLIQRYRIDEFGDYDVYELMRFSHATPNISYSFIEIDNRKGKRNLLVRLSAEPVRPYNMNAEEARQRLKLYTIQRGKVYVIKHTMNVENGTICSVIGESIENYKSRIPMWKLQMLMVAGDESDSWCLDVKRHVVTSNLYGDFSCTGPPNTDRELSALKQSKHDRNNNQLFVWVKKLRSYMRIPRSKEEMAAAKASPILTLLSTEDDLSNNNDNDDADDA